MRQDFLLFLLCQYMACHLLFVGCLVSRPPDYTPEVVSLAATLLFTDPG
jgi:hypothetical protein